MNPEKNNWTALIDDIVAGNWFNPELNQNMEVDYESIVFKEDLEGGEADLVASLDLGKDFAVVSDENARDVLGARVARSLEALGTVESIVLEDPHADLETVEDLRGRLKSREAVVAVGSGTINDLCKYATHLDGRPYCVFATSASMNGYTSSTASMNLESGLKVSMPAQVPKGLFVDLAVSANAPPHLAASGFGDCLARSVAQVDWYMSHRLLGTDYWWSPYKIVEEDENTLNSKASLLPKGDIAAIGSLHRVLTLCGLGIAVTKVSNHGSMGEHQISHYIDCFAGDRHPGTLHGQQVGVASLSMARLQQMILGLDTPPKVSVTRIDFDDMARRMGADIAGQCKEQWEKKAFSDKTAGEFNARLEEAWPGLKEELAPFMIPAARMEELLRSAGGPCTAGELGLDVGLYREALLHGHEMRNRFSFVDIAASAGLLEGFAESQM